MSSAVSPRVLGTVKAKMAQFKRNIEDLLNELEIKTKILESEKEKNAEAETEVASLQRRIRQLEDDLESTETRLTEATAKLEEASKAADESERFRRILQSRQVADDDRIERLTTLVQQSANEAGNAKAKHDETSRRLVVAEATLEKAEQRVEIAEKYIRSMEEELRSVSGVLKSMELSEFTASKQNEVYRCELQKLTRELEEAENRSSEAETETALKLQDLAQLQEELEREHFSNESLRTEMENMMSDLQSI